MFFYLESLENIFFYQLKKYNSARKYYFCKYSCKSSFEEEKTQKQIYLLISLFIKQKYNNFSNVIEFISKTVIGQYNLRTIFLHSHWRK